MLTAVCEIACEAASATDNTLRKANRLLDYAAMTPCNERVFTACDMVLVGQSDASYLSRKNARSVAGYIFYYTNTDCPTHINGAVACSSSVIDVVVASAAEGEYAALFQCMKTGEWQRAISTAIGYPQKATAILGDNKCATGLSNNTVKIKRSKSIDMRWHWARDRVAQGHFEVFWRKGSKNLADFFTKPLPVWQHQALMPLLVHTPDTGITGYPNRPARARRIHAFKTRVL
jgi:hypothetical protein